MRAVILFVLFLFSINSLFAQQNSPPSWGGVGGGAPIRVLTWNIYMRPAFLFWNGQFKRAKAIGKTLKEENYDIILFQEAFGKTSRKKLRKALGDEFPYEIEPAKHKAITNNGLWVLSKHPIEKIERVFFESCLVGDCQSSKGAVLFEVEINGQPYQFVNTHVQAEDGKEFAMVRQEQFEMIRQLLDSNQQKKTPQFILGDLNTAKKAKDEYNAMQEVLNASDGEISIIGETELSTEKPATWGCANNDLIKKKWKGQTYLLDYALQRETGYPFKLRRELKTYTQQWSKKRKHLSDHYAISLTIHP